MKMYRGRLSTGLFGLALLGLVGTSSLSAYAQGGYNDPRVMIQGFEWESHQNQWRYNWYDNVQKLSTELANAKFDLIWLPPPSQADGAGYHPEQYLNFSNNYGSDIQQRLLLRTLLSKGIEPIADVVINHRNGSGAPALLLSNH